MRNVLVTGASDGIGLALCKQLVKDHGLRVFLCARNPAKGADALRDVQQHCIDSSNNNSSGDGDATVFRTPNDVPVELVVMDVGIDESVRNASKRLRDEGVKLDVVVNNAGIGLSDSVNARDVLNVNLHGPKRVVDHLLPLLNTESSQPCRIVNVGSGAGPMFVAKQDVDKQKRLCEPSRINSWDDILNLESEGWDNDSYKGYGLSKALLASYTLLLAKQFRQSGSNIVAYCLTPGFVDTKLTRGRGARLTPAQGTKSTRHCIFEAEPDQSGWYFGSDCQRSPLNVLRSPGEPVFDGVYRWQK